jgi:hypothetical protein
VPVASTLEDEVWEDAPTAVLVPADVRWVLLQRQQTQEPGTQLPQTVHVHLCGRLYMRRQAYELCSKTHVGAGRAAGAEHIQAVRPLVPNTYKQCGRL